MGKLAATDRNSFAIVNNALFYWGSVLTHHNRVQSDSAQQRRLMPEEPLLSDCQAVAADAAHVLIIDTDNNLWIYGSNSWGVLGIEGDLRFVDKPLLNTSISQITQLATNFHGTSLAIDKDNVVYGWGYDGPYRLLSGGTEEIQTAGVFAPKKLSFLPPDLKQVNLGWQHGLALDSDGYVWTWGRKDDAPEQFENVSASKIDGLSHVRMVSSGSDYSLAVCADGTVWSWGDNNHHGQLGDGTTLGKTRPERITLEHIIYVSAGFWHSLAIDEEGNVWGWGDNRYGQLGKESLEHFLIPRRIPNVSGIIEAKCGLTHSIALDHDGHVWTWGSNNFGQLGTGDMKARLVPVQVM